MIASFEDRLLSTLRAFNHILHAFLAIALVLASIMVLWEFIMAVVHSFEINNLAHGFLQALGTLFIVWTLSSLISAEINYVQTGVFHVVVFIEVAMITLLRQLIVEPVRTVTAGQSLEQAKYLLVASPIIMLIFNFQFVIPSLRMYVGDKPKELKSIISTLRFLLTSI